MSLYPKSSLHNRTTGCSKRTPSKLFIAGMQMRSRALHDTGRSSAALNIAQAMFRCLSKREQHNAGMALRQHIVSLAASFLWRSNRPGMGSADQDLRQLPCQRSLR